MEISKVTYDLHQLDPSFIPSLRDSLVSALGTLAGSPKTVVVQLSLALAGLALQFPDWQETAVQSMIDKFGQNPATVPTLLEFLTVLPEEITSNTKIPVTVSHLRSPDIPRRVTPGPSPTSTTMAPRNFLQQTHRQLPTF